MAETKISEGITDITTSEGSLKRFSRICKLFGDQGRAMPRNRVVQLIKDQIGLKSDKVIGRHISILEKLSIIENKEGMYILSSEGKVLYDFVEDLKNNNELNSYEITFYFRTLFTHLFDQLYPLLKTIDKYNGKGRDFIIIQYFENEDLKLWKKRTAKINLENKFRCMEKWLQTLNIKMLNNFKIIIEGDRYYNHLNQLWRESAIVRSMMTGKDSKLAYISLELES